MARRKTRRSASGRFVKAASNPVRRLKRRARRNPVSVSRRRARRNAYFMNPKRSHHRRRARRNPPMFSGNKLMGISIAEIAYAGAGFIAPPAVEGFARGFLPATFTQNVFGRYALKIGAVAALSFAGGKFINRDAGKYIAIGGATYILANAVIEFFPSLFSGFSGYMNPGRTFQPTKARRSLGMYQAQPFMGMYQGIGTTPAKLPERVDPNARF